MIDEKLMAGSGFGKKMQAGFGIWPKISAGCRISNLRMKVMVWKADLTHFLLPFDATKTTGC